jgi:alkane 1-monooxygenase
MLAVVAQGFYWGLAQTAAHELCHRRNSWPDIESSRWLGALALEPTLHLHHPFCHHRFLGLMRDPGTARRGEHVYGFAIRSTLGNVAFAARAEIARLRRRSRGFLSSRNRFLTAWAICLAYVVVCAAIAGWVGVLVYLGSGIIARLLFDSTAYVEHYGLFRLEGEQISERLSWDVYFLSSNSVLYNAARHADHHLHPMRHYADLKIRPNAPRLNHAYITLVLMAFVPTLYWRTMQPHLDAWDASVATPDQLAFLHEKMMRRGPASDSRRAA